jgi:glycosyltransferase involved in cell wall biosynthesis
VTRLSVVVPAFKEASRIATTVQCLRRDLGPIGDVEIIVVDDGSTDDTADAARRAGADQVLTLPVNQGKGAAVRAGMLAAQGRVVAFTDADLTYAPDQLALLAQHVDQGWDVVVGTRYHVDTRTLVRARRLRELSGRLFSLLTRLVVLRRRQDTQCGLKAFRAVVARVLFTHARVDGFAFDVEILYLCERYGLSVKEVPVELTNSEVSTVHVAVDALRMMRDLLSIRRWAAGNAYDLRSEERQWLGPGGDGLATYPKRSRSTPRGQQR